MADSVPANVVNLLKSLTNLALIQQAQIAELQADRTTALETGDRLSAAVAALQGHAESVTGETGLTSQLGDLSELPALQEQLAAAMPAPAESPAPAVTSIEPANGAEPQAAAA